MQRKKIKFRSYKRTSYPEKEMIRRSREFHNWLNERRSVRDFSDKKIPDEVINSIIMAASTAPSGAHKQPWTFCFVTDPVIKKQIRIEAEKEERESYEGRMSEEWLEDLVAIGTDWHKPFLEIAPILIIVFRRSYELMPDRKKRQNYYVSESVGIACGFLLAAIHHAGLVALTHTPSPMNFLSKILNRPENEKPFLLIPVGYAADVVKVPDLERKTIDQVMVRY